MSKCLRCSKIIVGDDSLKFCSGVCEEAYNIVNGSSDEQLKAFTKHDSGKPRLELLDPEFITGVAQVLTKGAIKYEAYNWQRADSEDRERVKGALLRHMMSYMGGELLDPETGLAHMYHISCNAMFLAYYDRHSNVHPNQGNLKMDGFDPIGSK